MTNIFSITNFFSTILFSKLHANVQLNNNSYYEKSNPNPLLTGKFNNLLFLSR